MDVSWCVGKECMEACGCGHMWYMGWLTLKNLLDIDNVGACHYNPGNHGIFWDLITT